MHLLTYLLNRGLQVAAIDLDSRQRTLARYAENRQIFAQRHDLDLKMPVVEVLADRAESLDTGAFAAALDRLMGHQILVIDCPGRDSVLSREAHAHADTLITPMNDSFVDLDLLATIDPDSFKIIRPSFYAELIWRCRQMRAKRDKGHIDWVVLRTRLSHLEARNMRRVGAALEELAKRIGFRVVPGLSERVVYREMFPKGLTLTDLRDVKGLDEQLTISHVAARQELRDLVEALKLPLPQPAAVAAE